MRETKTLAELAEEFARRLPAKWTISEPQFVVWLYGDSSRRGLWFWAVE